MAPAGDTRPSAPARTRAAPGWLPWLGALVVLLVIPLVVSSGTTFTILNAIAISSVFALSYNMLLGQAGLLSFGSALFYGMGGYAAIHAMNAIGAGDQGFWANFPVFALPLVGFLGGGLAALIIGWPCCRRGGVAFAMITLGLGELVATGSEMFPSFFGGESGVNSDRMVGPVLFGLELAQPRDMYWFTASWLLVAAWAMWAFSRTPLGRMSNAVRDNDERLRFIGYPSQTIRFLVLVASGGFGGLAGAMAAVNYEIMTPDMLGLVASGTVLLMAAIGGAGVFYGPILGAILFSVMSLLLQDYTPASVFYIGLVFLLVIMFAPRGLAGAVERVREVRKRGVLRQELPGWAIGTLGTALIGLGLVTIVEALFQLRHGQDEMARRLGVDFDIASPWTWLAAAAFLALGLVVRRAARRRDEEADA